MKLAWQLVTFHSSPHLVKLLPALADQTLRDRVLFVRDHSGDAAEQARVQELLQASGLVYQFEIGENVGFARGHNALFSQHDAEYVALVNPDLMPEPTYYEALVARLEADSSLGAVQGVLLRGTPDDPRGIDSLGLEVRGLGDVRDAGAGSPIETWLNRRDPVSVYGVSGAASVFRRASLMRASLDGSLMDARFFLYKEDVELALRLHRSGARAELVPAARSWHVRSVGRRGLIARFQDEFRRSPVVRVSSYANQWKIYFLHASCPPHWSSLGKTVFAELLRTFALLLSPKLFVRAWREILRDAPDLLKSRRALARTLIASWHDPVR